MGQRLCSCTPELSVAANYGYYGGNRVLWSAAQILKCQRAKPRRRRALRWVETRRLLFCAGTGSSRGGEAAGTSGDACSPHRSSRARLTSGWCQKLQPEKSVFSMTAAMLREASSRGRWYSQRLPALPPCGCQRYCSLFHQTLPPSSSSILI